MKAICEISIKPGKLEVNGGSVFHSDAKSDLAFFKDLYLKLNLDYPKFYKMDEVSKLCFLAVEQLLKSGNWSSENGNATAIVVGTTDGCLESDKKHLASITEEPNLPASPATFVYTLPNIMLGEVCIRHGITGENTCLIMPYADYTFINQYAHILFDEPETAFCIAGYVNYQPENYKCFLTLYAKD